LHHANLINIGSREYYIKKIMATYNYDRENAEKAFEYMKYKRANYTLGKQKQQQRFKQHIEVHNKH